MWKPPLTDLTNQGSQYQLVTYIMILGRYQTPSNFIFIDFLMEGTWRFGRQMDAHLVPKLFNFSFVDYNSIGLDGFRVHLVGYYSFKLDDF